jgi:hypothetical protein
MIQYQEVLAWDGRMGDDFEIQWKRLPPELKNRMRIAETPR